MVSCIAKQEVETIARTFLTEFKKVSVSQMTVNAQKVRDISGRYVFSGKSGITGWLVFIDENTLANWAHECTYLLIISRDDIIKVKGTMPPSGIELTEVR